MKTLIFSALFVLLSVSNSKGQVSIISYNDSWKYLDNGTNQATAWRSSSFNDGLWKTGNGKFGYGTTGATTIISYGPDKKHKYVTTYFRKTFSLADPTAFAFYAAQIKRDDGAVVYINGTEVYRSNMPTGSISYTTLASTSASDNGNTGQLFNINNSAFVAGSNVIAVEIHQKQTGASESDMAFDFSLVTPDLIAPLVLSMNRQSPSGTSTNATSVTFRCTFSEWVTGVDATDFTATVVSGTLTGNITSVTPVGTDGSTYDITVSSISGNGVVQLDLKTAGTGIADAAANAILGGFTGGQTYTINTGTPTLTSVSILSNNSTTSIAKPGDVISLSFTASELINPTNVTIANHTLTPIAGNNNSFIATYAMAANDVPGIIPFSIDFSNNVGTAGTQVTTTTNGSSVSFDNTAPTVTSINRQSPATNPTGATSVTFRITFSEAVSGVDLPDFSITTSGSANGTLLSVTIISGNTYDVTIASVSGNGTLRLDLNGSGTGITDAAGNAIAAGFTAGQTYTIQPGLPSLTFVSISSSNSNTLLAKPGDLVTLSFSTSEAINPPTVTIATHLVTATAGSNNSFIASYTMTASDASGVIPFTIDFISTAGVAGTQGTTTTDGSAVNFDNSYPTVVSINRQAPAASTTSATTVVFRATFSEPVTGADLSDFSLVTGSTVSGVLSSITLVSAGVYDLTIGSITGNGTLGLDLKATGTGIADVAGNIIQGGFNGQIYTIQQTLQGFTSVTALTPIPVSQYTKDKPQDKIWNYAGKWWCVLATSGGTKIFRLDGTSWTAVLTIATNTSCKPDCWMTGNVVHILLYKGISTSDIVSVEYDAASNAYKPWSQRPTSSSVTFPTGTETATMTVDGAGRMWLASDGDTDIKVWWSDSPYATWSSAITIATGVTTDDISVITKMNGKIGIFWSNQNTQRFGFKTHTDGAVATSWSADEVPASQSALNAGKGMSDDHMSAKLASDGTLYFAVKTSYDLPGYPLISLLIRRPTGIWDNLYPVTINQGTQPHLILNEAQGKIKVVYTTVVNGGNIVYRESSMSNISFGVERTLISGGGYLYNYTTSTHQTCNPDVVIMATNQSTNPIQAVSVLASDDPSGASTSTVSASAVTSETNIMKKGKAEAATVFKSESDVNTQNEAVGIYPNPFMNNAVLRFSVNEESDYTVTLYNSMGAKVKLLGRGKANAGKLNTINIDGSQLAPGMYLAHLVTNTGTKTIKLVRTN
ncbi:hypothetical protein BH10BAC3_BH10BAC3_22160 [soil metagenome]